MNSPINELRYTFEKNLKWKLNQKAKTSADEFKILMNTFRYYDYNPSGKIDKEQWKQAILKIGLISFSDENLNDLFDYYLSKQNINDSVNSEYLNYKDFVYNLLYTSSSHSPIIIRNNFFNRNNNPIKSFNYSYDFQSKNKNNEENTKDKNIFNYRINVNIKNEQHINKNNDEIEENKNLYNNNFNTINLKNNSLNYSYNNNSYKNINLNNNKIMDINDKNSNINLKLFIKNIIDIFRSKVNKDNGVTFYTLLQNIKLNTAYEQNSDILFISKLNLILKESNLNFTPKELQSLFCILDFNDKGYISIKKFLKVLTGNLNEYRKKLLINIFQNQIDIYKNGAISIYYFKELYNAKNHPDVLNKKMSESEAKTQFNYTFEIFCKLYKILGEINCSDFIKYYEGISPSISDDIYFKEIIYNVWKRTNNFDETYFPSINYKNINFNLEKKINRSISSPLISFNNKKLKLNTIGNIQNSNNYNNNFNSNNYKEQNNLLNSNYLNYKKNTLNTSLNNNNKIILKKVNFTPISNYPKINNPLMLNDIQNNNMYNYQFNNNINKNSNIKVNKSLNLNSIPHSNINKCYTPVKYNTTQIRNSNITINVESNTYKNKDKFTYSQILLNSLRNFLIKRGNKSIFYLQRMLTNCDTRQNGLITLEQLNNIFRAYNFNIYYYDIKLLFDLFDKNKVGIIQYDNLIKGIVGTMNERRKNIIIKVYDSLNKDLYGYINIKEIKNKYNCYKHPEVIKGNKTHEEVYGDFLECIEIYREYIRNINKGYNDLFSLNEFLEFFEELSMYIIHDNDFENLICNCWDLN